MYATAHPCLSLHDSSFHALHVYGWGVEERNPPPPRGSHRVESMARQGIRVRRKSVVGPSHRPLPSNTHGDVRGGSSLAASPSEAKASAVARKGGRSTHLTTFNHSPPIAAHAEHRPLLAHMLRAVTHVSRGSGRGTRTAMSLLTAGLSAPPYLAADGRGRRAADWTRARRNARRRSARLNRTRHTP